MEIEHAISQLPGRRTLQNLARNKGYPYIVFWAHRICGTALFLYVLLHIITLSGLTDPNAFSAKMALFSSPFFVALEWALAIPVIFHGLNGGRLILYEVYGTRQDRLVLNWVLSLSIAYLFLLTVFMILGNQSVSSVFFWLYVAFASFAIGYSTVTRLKSSRASVLWKLQRISGAFMLLMIPAHMIFMHLDPEVGRNSQVILQRLDNWFIKLIDILLVASVLYHGAYGILGMCRDYMTASRNRTVLTVIVIVITLFFGLKGITLALFI